MSTGYEGGPQEVKSTQIWVVKKETMYPNKLLALVTCNDETRGFLTIRSKEEFKWVQARLTGERKLEEKELSQEG